jgi:hypothetical protein
MKLLPLFLLMTTVALAQNRPPFSIEDLMKSRPEQFGTLLAEPEKYEIQILYTQIDRDERNRPTFTTHGYRVDKNRYFYPASTVKLPTAVLALERLNQLKIKGLTKYSTMHTGAQYERQTPVLRDSTASTGQPSVAHYVKKILLVSDNDAHNRLYEFLGQEYLNETLHAKGYENVRIVHRLQLPMTREQNRRTNPVTFLDAKGRVLYQQPLVTSQREFVAPEPIKRGKGFMREGKLVNEPFDFTHSNYFALEDQHRLLRAILFPESVEPKNRFTLTPDDQRFLRQYLSQYPTETRYPAYPPNEYWPAYCKFLLYGSAKSAVPAPAIRIFNKVGDAYGYLLDNAYVVDFENGVEFLLTAVIHVNEDGIFNDDRYEYDTVGFPFMKNLGQAIYDYDRQRPRARKPDLSEFRMSYEK